MRSKPLLLELMLDGRVADTSGHRHKIVLTGHPQFVAGRDGPCLLFADNGMVEVKFPPRELGPAFTIECWVKPARVNQWEPAVGPDPGGAGAVWMIPGLAILQKPRQAENNHFRLLGYEPPTGIEATMEQWLPAGFPMGVVFRPAWIEPEQWHHVAMTRTPQATAWYLDGVAVDVRAGGLDLSTSEGSLRIGVHFHGALSALRVWRKALSAAALPVPDRERRAAFTRLARIEAGPGGPAGVCALALADAHHDAIPADLTCLALELAADPWGGVNRPCVALGTVTLARRAGFRTKVDFAKRLPPGCYTVSARPALPDGTALPEAKFSAHVPPRAAALKPLRGKAAANVAPSRFTAVTSLDGKGWLIATDPENAGRRERWWQAPRPVAKSTKVPWVIQDVFPDYHGVAWYWRKFRAASNAHRGGRYLLRFRAVDYLAEVWLNGRYVGGHEGGETPFVLDVTHALRPSTANLLAVRVLNPAYEPIDGIALKACPSGAKQYPVQSDATYNAGGIVDGVDLMAAPAVRIADLHVRPDWKTGAIAIRATVRNTGRAVAPCRLDVQVAPAAGGMLQAGASFTLQARPGDALAESELRVAPHRLWDVNDPFLYRVSARVQAEGDASADEVAARCGFRGFCFERGYFRLNGRRIFPYGALYCNQSPVSYTVPLDPDLLRRDVLNMKTLGVNLCRIAFGGSHARHLDVFDELGVMVYQEHFASWQMAETPALEKRFDRSLGEIILRDRNHPAIVTWGCLNETPDGRLVRHVMQSLPMIRALDPDRMVMLDSGRPDLVWALSNPGSRQWDGRVRDTHIYPIVPHPRGVLDFMRTMGVRQNVPMFFSEYGQCGAINLPRLLRQYEQCGHADADDARYCATKLEQVRADWKRWRLDECWPRMEDYFAESERTLTGLRLTGESALRANPQLVALSLTYTPADMVYAASGPTSPFRELKPGGADVLLDLAAPLRWCLFVEPVSVYRGANVLVEAVLSNRDALKPGKFPVRFQVVGPAATSVFDRTVTIDVPGANGSREPPFAFPVFRAAIAVNGPSGKYRFLATFARGGAATGGETEFTVADRADLPAVHTAVTLLGDDARLTRWLTRHGIGVRPFRNVAAAQVVLISGQPVQTGGDALVKLARQVRRGATAIFLDPGLLPLLLRSPEWAQRIGKARLATPHIVGGFYRADDWAKPHPIFAGLPTGVMDYGFYREIIPQDVFMDLNVPDEAVSGALRASGGLRLADVYASGLHVSVHRLGRGRFILNNLRIRENLGQDPAAERLLRNSLNYAAGLERGDA
jgi:hypothetical protein